jgi:filamentous hemagglutinin
MFSSDKRHEQWGCGSAEECTALYGSAYTSVGGAIDPPTPVGNIAATIEAPNLKVTSGGQIINVGNVIGQSVSLTGTNLANGITKANTYTPTVGNPSQVISLAPSSGGLNLSIPATLGGYSLTQMKRTMGPQLIPGEVVRGTVGSAPSAASPIANTSSGINYVLNGTGTTLDPVSPQLLLSNLPANLQPSTTLFYYNPQA